MTTAAVPSSAYYQVLLPFVTFCGRYSSLCPLTSPSSAPDVWWCPRRDHGAPNSIQTSTEIRG